MWTYYLKFVFSCNVTYFTSNWRPIACAVNRTARQGGLKSAEYNTGKRAEEYSICYVSLITTNSNKSNLSIFKIQLAIIRQFRAFLYLFQSIINDNNNDIMYVLNYLQKLWSDINIFIRNSSNVFLLTLNINVEILNLFNELYLC